MAEIGNDFFPQRYTDQAFHDVDSFNEYMVGYADVIKKKAGATKPTTGVSVLFLGDEEINKPAIVASYNNGTYTNLPPRFPSFHSFNILQFNILNLPIDLYAFELRPKGKEMPEEYVNLHFDGRVEFDDFSCIILVFDANDETTLYWMRTWYENYVEKSLVKYRERNVDISPYLFVLGLDFERGRKGKTEKKCMKRGVEFSKSIKAEFWSVNLDDPQDLNDFFYRIATLALIYSVKRHYKNRLEAFRDDGGSSFHPYSVRRLSDHWQYGSLRKSRSWSNQSNDDFSD